MIIMQQSSKAQDRALGVWFQHIQQGLIKLPRFQRPEAWDQARIKSFLNTVVNNLPVGVCLALEVAGNEKFSSRYIATAEPQTTGTVTQHLLDGQQRLTAFWRAVHNNYDWVTFFVYVPSLSVAVDNQDTEIEVRSVVRWHNKQDLPMPRWAESEERCLERGYLPMSLLQPGDIADPVNEWVDKATAAHKPRNDDPSYPQKLEAYFNAKTRVRTEITQLRERVTYFNLPYLSLPAATDKDVALQVFINMNTNIKPLSIYDIIVAEVESAAGQSLHDLQQNLADACPNALRYGDLSNLMLTTSALLQDKQPNERGMLDMDMEELIHNWSKLERGLKRMASFLITQRIFDETRLPTNAVLAVIAAAYEQIPDNGDYLAKAESLLRRYMWSAFFTDRYDNSAASSAFADFKAIKSLLANPAFTEDDLAGIPILNRDNYPLAGQDALMTAGWPKKTGILARAILAVTTYFGGFDFADHRLADYDSIQEREYHHIFPDALMKEIGIGSFLALNCTLITWKTNRIIGRKDPLDYLQERVNWVDEVTVRERLKSHLIDFDWLAKAQYETLEENILKEQLFNDFHGFLEKRAHIVSTAIQMLANGQKPQLHTVWSVAQSNEG